MKYSTIYIRCKRNIYLAFKEYCLKLSKIKNKDKVDYEEALMELMKKDPIANECLLSYEQNF